MVAPRESRWARLVSGVAAATGLVDTKPSDNRKAARTGSTHRRCLLASTDPFISTYLLPVGGPTRPRDRVSANRCGATAVPAGRALAPSPAPRSPLSTSAPGLSLI